MAIVTVPAAGSAAVSLAECKAALRLDRDDEDALIAAHVRTATQLCEAFIGQWLIVREGRQRLAADGDWQRLGAQPVVAVLAVEQAGTSLADSDWAGNIDADGNGWVRCAASGVMVAEVRFTAGIASDWNGLPEPLRAGIIRLVAHLYSHRDAADAGPPPAAVAALWRPWRRMRLA